ncbi:hypothetical protein KFL_001140080 [Klebsormidium nitens]|uniref:UVR domain-containing protein n=1 Tax=Klebsormidium nitens TaxID=105231 RepID=A0A1Y1HV58_KLENI|nr:hypothetical protein KFL_001140080 [Klebsormidium nitens]|eukprot:GAQ82520.1 hypothetical protein KFL_001140080 [Klebsormidium nitens]
MTHVIDFDGWHFAPESLGQGSEASADEVVPASRSLALEDKPRDGLQSEAGGSRRDLQLETAGEHYAEKRDGGAGGRFFEVLMTSMHNVDNGCILGLLCTGNNRGPWLEGLREFPLFLNKLGADALQQALDKGGLPHALESLERMQDHDLQKIWVTAFDDERRGGEFSLLDERTGERKQLTSTFPQALGVAIRYREPFLLERDALLSANADFVDRMVINPKAREHPDDVDMLARLSTKMRLVAARVTDLERELTSAVEAEQYEDAARLKIELERAQLETDAALPGLLKELKDLYLQKMRIFFKL